MAKNITSGPEFTFIWDLLIAWQGWTDWMFALTSRSHWGLVRGIDPVAGMRAQPPWVAGTDAQCNRAVCTCNRHFFNSKSSKERLTCIPCNPTSSAQSRGHLWRPSECLCAAVRSAGSREPDGKGSTRSPGQPGRPQSRWPAKLNLKIKYCAKKLAWSTRIWPIVMTALNDVLGWMR